MKFFKALVVVMLLAVQVLLASCTTALTKSEIAFQEVPPPDAYTVIIYVYRLKSMVGSAVTWAVRLDGEVVANLNQNAYVVLYTTPGDHSVTIGDPSTGSLIRGFFGYGALGVVPAYYADKAEMSSAEEKGALPIDPASEPSADPQDRVYFFRSAGFKVEYVSRNEAMSEIVHMKYEPNLTEG